MSPWNVVTLFLGFLITFFLPCEVFAAAIDSIEPRNIEPGETVVTINGSGFGAQTGKFLYFGGRTAYPLSWSDTSITVRAPLGVTSQGVVSISGSFVVGRECYQYINYCYDKTQWQELTSPLFYLIPQIVTSTETIHKGGLFEIMGLNFGSLEGDVLLSDRTCRVKKWQNTYILCEVPELYQSGSVSFSIIVPSANGYRVSGSTFFAPQLSNDPYSFHQSYIRQAKINDVWAHYTGKGITVAVIDSGVDINHPDLKESMWFNTREIPGNSRDDDGNGYVDDYYGYNFLDSSANLSPKNNHGTIIAGIIAAKRNNSTGVAGIAPDAKVMSLIACSISCPESVVLRAMRYAVDNGVRIINLSLGGRGTIGYSTEYDEIIQYATDRNVLVIAAAGNGDLEGGGTRGQDLNIISASPVCNNGDYNGVLGVGALDKNNLLTYWSNYGDRCVDIWTSGEDIFSTVVPRFSKGASYGLNDGTSFSAPIVAGVAALVMQKNPTWTQSDVMGHIINHSDNSQSGFGKILNARPIIENSRSEAVLSDVQPRIIDSSSQIVRISGKNFHSSNTVRLFNSSASFNLPTHILKIRNAYIEFDVQKINGLSSSSIPYSIEIGGGVFGGSILDSILEIRTINRISEKAPEIIPIKQDVKKEKTVVKEFATILKSLSVRQTPNVKGKIIGSVKRNQKFEIIDRKNKAWVKIKYGKTNGWVIRSGVKL